MSSSPMTAPLRSPDRPPHRSPGPVACVAAGGAAGTLVRALLGEFSPTPAGAFPWTTFSINVTGAFILGSLLHLLALTGPDEGGRRLVRLGVGTGVLGGFTTYSAFAVDAVVLAQGGRLATATAYVVGSITVGVLGAWAGTRVASATMSRIVRRHA